ncbi:hypothetical protein [Paenibacillus pinihumi]|uniref:hypothetical protein n=1 Tax=Paenibacillus pinihumi TaxID=669462 RepID=UPI00040F983F|nr:hypothetical protein [Paenibacillus pinihumi]
MGWLDKNEGVISKISTAIFTGLGTGLIFAGEYVQAIESLLIGTLIYGLYRMNLKLEKK